jgi:hypothetical protein
MYLHLDASAVRYISDRLVDVEILRAPALFAYHYSTLLRDRSCLYFRNWPTSTSRSIRSHIFVASQGRKQKLDLPPSRPSACLQQGARNETNRLPLLTTTFPVTFNNNNNSNNLNNNNQLLFSSKPTLFITQKLP